MTGWTLPTVAVATVLYFIAYIPPSSSDGSDGNSTSTRPCSLGADIPDGGGRTITNIDCSDRGLTSLRGQPGAQLVSSQQQRVSL